MRWIAAAAAAAAACSSSSSPTTQAAFQRCEDLAACTAACAPCKTGDCSQAAGHQCNLLGQLHLRGQPPQFDPAAAASAFETGCKSYAPACVGLALQVQDGRGVPYDPARAIELYQRACDHGAGVGCFNIAVMYEGGVGVAQDSAKAKVLFERAEKLYLGECEVDPGWCSNIGYLYEMALVGDKKDPARAAPIYRAACDRGDPDSCVSLANLELDGKGIPADRAAGIARLERTCDGPRGWLACAGLGQTRREDGDRVASNELYARACDGGIAHACALLGVAIDDGDGIAADPPRALGLFERACILGNALACLVRGDHARDTDAATAAAYFELACHIADPRGCMERAMLARDGKVPGDVKPWLEQACRQGMTDACEIVKEL